MALHAKKTRESTIYHGTIFLSANLFHLASQHNASPTPYPDVSISSHLSLFSQCIYMRISRICNYTYLSAMPFSPSLRHRILQNQIQNLPKVFPHFRMQSSLTPFGSNQEKQINDSTESTPIPDMSRHYVYTTSTAHGSRYFLVGII